MDNKSTLQATFHHGSSRTSIKDYTVRDSMALPIDARQRWSPQVPGFFSATHPETRWLTRCIRNEDVSSLRERYNIHNSVYRSKFYQLMDFPAANVVDGLSLQRWIRDIPHTIGKGKAILYLTPLGVAIFMKSIAVTRLFCGGPDASNTRPMVDVDEINYASSIDWLDATSRSVLFSMPMYSLIVLREFYQSIPYVAHVKSPLTTSITCQYRRTYCSLMTSVRDILQYGLHLLSKRPALRLNALVKSLFLTAHHYDLERTNTCCQIFHPELLAVSDATETSTRSPRTVLNHVSLPRRLLRHAYYNDTAMVSTTEIMSAVETFINHDAFYCEFVENVNLDVRSNTTAYFFDCEGKQEFAGEMHPAFASLLGDRNVLPADMSRSKFCTSASDVVDDGQKCVRTSVYIDYKTDQTTGSNMGSETVKKFDKRNSSTKRNLSLMFQRFNILFDQDNCLALALGILTQLRQYNGRYSLNVAKVVIKMLLQTGWMPELFDRSPRRIVKYFECLLEAVTISSSLILELQKLAKGFYLQDDHVTFSKNVDAYMRKITQQSISIINTQNNVSVPGDYCYSLTTGYQKKVHKQFGNKLVSKTKAQRRLAQPSTRFQESVATLKSMTD